MNASLLVKGLLVGLVATTVACSSASPEEAGSDEGAATAASPIHTPAPGTPERTAIFEGLRKAYDVTVGSNPAAGTKDVEFDVSGDGIFRVSSRNGVNWAFLAAKAVKPGTQQPYDLSHAPQQVQANAQDEEGKPDNRIIAIMKQSGSAWQVASPRGFAELYFAPGDVAWTELPCTAGAPFGLLEGATASQAECASGNANAKQPVCHDVTNVLTKVPADQLGEVTKDFVDLDGATKVSSKLDADGTFTVEATIAVCE